MTRRIVAELLRICALLAIVALSLQIYFFGRIALVAVVDPQSTSFQRSEAWRLLVARHGLQWQQSWVDYPRLSVSLKRAVIASEDSGFSEHSGVEWDALERAWEKNQKAVLRTNRINERVNERGSERGNERGNERGSERGSERAGERRERQTTSGALGQNAASRAPSPIEPRLIGASTITQQLAKNLFLSSERTLTRKGEEFIVTFMLEALLTKARILEIYLNDVEWGEGVFGAEAAARHYFGVSASALAPAQAARLAVMLPAPKRFEKRPGSGYVVGRAATVGARMAAVAVP